MFFSVLKMIRTFDYLFLDVCCQITIWSRTEVAEAQYVWQYIEVTNCEIICFLWKNHKSQDKKSWCYDSIFNNNGILSILLTCQVLDTYRQKHGICQTKFPSSQKEKALLLKKRNYLLPNREQEPWTFPQFLTRRMD